jgi:hypothetical protein
MRKINDPQVGVARCPETGCGPLLIAESPVHAVCRRCGLIYRFDGGGPVIDPTATRTALFRAADACAGPDCSLQALAFDRYGSDPAATRHRQRLALAETGVASLATLAP